MTALSTSITTTEGQNKSILETVQREQGRLFRFIRERVPETEDAEDILQDVFAQLIESYRAVQGVEKVTSWLFTVARNRITDWYRKKRPQAVSKMPSVRYGDGEEAPLSLTDILPDFSGSPDDEMMRAMVWEQLQDALDELPEEQREAFVQHEFEDRSFKELSEAWDVPVNTLLSRKRYAVLHIRTRLRELYDELKEG